MKGIPDDAKRKEVNVSSKLITTLTITVGHRASLVAYRSLSVTFAIPEKPLQYVRGVSSVPTITFLADYDGIIYRVLTNVSQQKH